jgi:hypothetical protein
LSKIRVIYELDYVLSSYPSLFGIKPKVVKIRGPKSKAKYRVKIKNGFWLGEHVGGSHSNPILAAKFSKAKAQRMIKEHMTDVYNRYSTNKSDYIMVVVNHV